MSDNLPITYSEAVIAVAQRDPALAALLMHHHECIEAVKADGLQRGIDLASLRSDFHKFSAEFRNELRTAVYAGVAILTSWCAFMAWQVITHPHGFAL